MKSNNKGKAGTPKPVKKSPTGKWAAFDRDYADAKTKYGARLLKQSWHVCLWQPLAKNVKILAYEKTDRKKRLLSLNGIKKGPNWHWNVQKDLDGCYYEFEITDAHGFVTMALDPYAKTIGAFNWQDPLLSKPLGRFIDCKVGKLTNMPALPNNCQPIVYEASVRDLTSLNQNVSNPGTYQAFVEAKIGAHLQKLGFTHIQLLPVHSCAAIDETSREILKKGEGKGWKTNYNWGYDPLNYFAVNGWLSTNPEDPYARVNELKALVKHCHKHGIGVILDVVYNHLFENAVLNKVLPDYYFREGSNKKAVKEPPLATERKMVRRLIIDSLVFMVQTYDVDGFRFDLMGFLDKETMGEIHNVLRAMKPNIVLHGEAWNFTDLKLSNALIKGVTDNDWNIAYFNDTSRDAIKGRDENGANSGLIAGNLEWFDDYLCSVLGNIKGIAVKRAIPGLPASDYKFFTKHVGNVLQYSACHDGHTLWDKVNLTIKGSKAQKMDAYKQALIMQGMLPGRQLYLQGTEILYTKPVDETGYEWQKMHGSPEMEDFHKTGEKRLAHNTYKTTDYSNGLRWSASGLEAQAKEAIKLMSAMNDFRKKTKFLNPKNGSEIKRNYVFKKTSDGIIDYSIKGKKQELRIMHNFTEKDYVCNANGMVLFESSSRSKDLQVCPAHSSLVLIRQTN